MRRASFPQFAAWAVCAACVLIFIATGARAQEAKFTVTDDCTAFTFSPDGSRIVYAARRYGKAKVPNGKKEKKVPIEDDDIWEVNLDGRMHRLVDGSKLIQGLPPFTYAIQAIRIAPDNEHMTVEMTTHTLAADEQRAEGVKSGQAVDLLNGNGGEIDIAGKKTSMIEGAINAAWLAGGQTVVYMKEAQGVLLYTLAYLRPATGDGGAMLSGHDYAAVAWSPQHNAAAAIEEGPGAAGSMRLVWIDLAHQTERTLANLTGFDGHLTVSPSATEIAYYHDGNTIEIRSVAQPDRSTQIKVPLGRYEWSADGTHLLLKRGPDDQSNQLIWITLPDGQYRDIYHGLIYHNFHVSPDGRWVAVTEPGEQILKLYPVP